MLTILSMAYPFSTVSTDAVGGAEQIVAALDDAIVRAGHRSIVIAREGSRTAGALVPVPAERGVLDGAAVGRVHASVMRAAAGVLDRERVDLVHMHGVDFERYVPSSGVPVLVTLHLPPTYYARDALVPRPNTHLCCVSFSQRAALPPWAPPADVVENGVPVDAFRPSASKAAFCLVLARICVEKGIHDALDAADEAGVPLVIAGETSSWSSHRRYFEEEIVPRLKPPHRWMGAVGFARKRRLLAAARAVLVPSRAPETSSLVTMEAMASGTPVIAYASGALPTLVDHGKTGFIVDDVHAMARAIAQVSHVSPEACRRTAEARFALGRMTERYMAAYERLAATPRTSMTSSAPTAEKVRGMAALDALSEEWSRLWHRCPTATPFQRPEWLLAYARTFCGERTEAEPWAVVVRRKGTMVGLAPVCTRPSPTGTATTLLGDGVSDYLDAVVDPEHREVSARALLEALRAECRADASVLLDELRSCSPLLVASSETDADVTVRRGPCPSLEFVAGVDPIPPSIQSSVRQCRRRAERIGALETEEMRGRAISDGLEALFGLHGARWTARGEAGVLGSAEVRAFLRDAVVGLSDVGMARVYGLRVGGRRCAALLVLCDARAA